MTPQLRQHAMRRIVAEMRFPGPDYYAVLKWLHCALKPQHYVEIGIFNGDSLQLAAPPTVALGIDPEPYIKRSWRTETHVVTMTSREFFSEHSLSDYFGVDRFDLAFVDGSHRFEQVVEDIVALEQFAGPQSVIAVHDTIPIDEKTAEPEPSITFHTGDVWKLIPFLRKCRPDLEFTTVRTGPSGLTLIRRLSPTAQRSEAEAQAVSEFAQLTWDYYARRRGEFLDTIPNEQGAVLRWLTNDQHHHTGL
jgi:hypothetical protein